MDRDRMMAGTDFWEVSNHRPHTRGAETSLFHCKICNLGIQSQPSGSLALTVAVSRNARVGLVESRTAHTRGGIERLRHLASLRAQLDHGQFNADFKLVLLVYSKSKKILTTAIANKVEQRMWQRQCWRIIDACVCFFD